MDFPTYSRDEVLADGVVHALSVGAAFLAAGSLAFFALNNLSTGASASIVIYCVGVLAVFCFSAAYNLSNGPRRWLLRRCDHAAIYVKIAATYTPFAAVKMGGAPVFRCWVSFGESPRLPLPPSDKALSAPLDLLGADEVVDR